MIHVYGKYRVDIQVANRLNDAGITAAVLSDKERRLIKDVVTSTTTGITMIAIPHVSGMPEPIQPLVDITGCSNSRRVAPLF